jgi:large conductance mechanosensitive channel
MTQKKVAKKTAAKTRTVTSKVKSKAKENTSGFLDFVRSQGIIGLAVGLVIGTQVKVLVDQLVKSFIDPLIGLFVGTSRGLSSKVFMVRFNGRQAAFGWGAFVYILIDFLLVALVIYGIIKWLKLDKLDKKKDS